MVRSGCVLVALWCAAVAGTADGAPRRVVLVSMDGLRPDAIAMAKAPVLAAMIAEGAWGDDARTILPSSTLPSHASMLTGLVPARHGVMLWNDYQPRRGQIKSPTFLGLAARAGRRVAMFAGKEKLWHLAGGVEAYRYVRDEPEAMADAVVEHVRAHELDALFVHFAEPDSTGHREGWLSEPQLAVIARVDAAYGRIREAVAATAWGKDVVWIVTADHGGHERLHGTPLKVDMQIPWIASGPGVRRGAKISREIRTYDTAPTALWLLGIERPAGLDGAVIDEAFEAAAPR